MEALNHLVEKMSGQRQSFFDRNVWEEAETADPPVYHSVECKFSSTSKHSTSGWAWMERRGNAAARECLAVMPFPKAPPCLQVRPNGLCACCGETNPLTAGDELPIGRDYWVGLAFVVYVHAARLMCTRHV